jgi:hypothetical protein
MPAAAQRQRLLMGWPGRAYPRGRSREAQGCTDVADQIRGFLLERGVTVRQGLMPLRKALPEILSSKFDAMSPRMINRGLPLSWRMARRSSA